MSWAVIGKCFLVLLALWLLYGIHLNLPVQPLRSIAVGEISRIARIQNAAISRTRSIYAFVLIFATEGLRMPYRIVISAELAKLFSVLSNPNRVRIIEELGQRELSVNEIQSRLNITHAAVSQQLAIMRTSRIVVERREGRNVLYHLKDPDLAVWVLAGIKFISPSQDEIQHMITAIDRAKSVWASVDEETQVGSSRPKRKRSNRLG